LLQARVGPQPFLLGEFRGCGQATGSQSFAAASSSQSSYALTADLDWGVDLKAEALALNKEIGNPWIIHLMPDKKPRHIFFLDLAPHSTALLAGLNGLTPTSVGRSGVYTIRMPKCYPYTDPIQYEVKWNGGASATTANSKASPEYGMGGIKLAGKSSTSSAANSKSACTWQAGQGDCWGDPLKDTSLNLAWPQAGSYTVSAMPVIDQHGRKFNEPATPMQVSVQP